MPLSLLAVFLGIPLLVLGIFARYTLGKQHQNTNDAWLYLMMAAEIEDNNYRMPDSLGVYTSRTPLSYPPGFPYLLVTLPQSLRKKHRWLVGPAIDLFHMGVLVTVSYIITSNISVAVLAVGIYAVTPELLKHFPMLTPRVLGSLLFTTTTLVTVRAVGGGPIWYVPALVGGVAILLTHKMTTQAMVLTYSTLALLQREPGYLLVVGGSFLVAFLLFRRTYLRVLRGHISIVNYWRKRHAEGTPPGAFLRDLGYDRDDSGPVSVFEQLKHVVKTVEPLEFIFMNPWLYLLPVVVYGLGLRDGLSPFAVTMTHWALAILVIAVLTQYVPVFKLIGEGHKYYMWGAFPTAYVLGETFIRVTPLQMTAYIVPTLVSLGFVFTLVTGDVSASKRFDEESAAFNVIRHLRESKKDGVLCAPPSLSNIVAYLADEIVYFSPNPADFDPEAEYFPTPQKPVEEIALENDMDFVLLDTTQIVLDQDDFDTYVVVARGDGFVLLER